jgi:hypothetical protein
LRETCVRFASRPIFCLFFGAFTSDFADVWSALPTQRQYKTPHKASYDGQKATDPRDKNVGGLLTSREDHDGMLQRQTTWEMTECNQCKTKSTEDCRPSKSILQCRQQRASRVRQAYSGNTLLAGIHRPQSLTTPCFTFHQQISSARRAPFPHGSHTRDERRNIKRQTPESLIPSLHILSVSHRQNRTEQL